jgi:hypothetical protein
MFTVKQVRLRCPHEPFLYLEHDFDNAAHRRYEEVGFKSMSQEDVEKAAGKRYEGRVFMRLELS